MYDIDVQDAYDGGMDVLLWVVCLSGHCTKHTFSYSHQRTKGTFSTDQLGDSGQSAFRGAYNVTMLTQKLGLEA